MRNTKVMRFLLTAAAVALLTGHAHAAATKPPSTLAELADYCAKEPNVWVLGGAIDSFIAAAPEINRPIVFDALDQSLGRATDPGRRQWLAKRFMDEALAQDDSKRLHAFLTKHAALLQNLLPWETAVWRLQLTLLDGDQEAAKTALKALVALKPEFETSAEYTGYLYRIHSMSQGGIMPVNTDSDTGTIENAVRKFTRDGATNALHRFMRNTLLGKADVTVRDPADNDLFTGAKTLCRALFAPYSRGYADYLAAQTALLEKQPALGVQAEARQLRRTAGLSAPQVSVPPLPGLRSARLASGAFNGFRPLAALPPGVPEWLGEGCRYAINGSAGADFNGVAIVGENLIVQNSRVVTCLRQGREAWTRASPLGSAWAGNPDLPNTVYPGGRLVPAVAGDVVVARLFDWANRNMLVGLSLADGHCLWQWPSDAGEPISNPAFWGTNRVVMLASRMEENINGMVNPYERNMHTVDAVLMDAASGAVLLRLPLCKGLRNLAFGRWNQLEHYRHCPAPAVDGNIAYVDTGLGMVGAIDLADESILWLRAYPRKSDPSATGSRMPASPIAGPANVLFAPFDASRLLLLDKKSGRLVEQRMGIPWTAVVPCAGKGVAALTANTATFLDMEKLNETGRTATKGLRLAGVCAEGVLIQHGTEAALCDAAGKALAKLRLPPGVQPLAAADGQLYGATGTVFDQFGLVTSDREPAAAPVPDSIPPGPGFFSFTRAIPMPRGGLALNGHILTRFDDSGRRLWERPIESDNPLKSAVSDGRTVTLLHAGRAWICDEATGALRAVWPSAPASATNQILCLSVCGGVTYAVMASTNGPVLARLSVEAPPAVIGPPLPATVVGQNRQINLPLCDFFVSFDAAGTAAAAVFLSQFPSSVWHPSFLLSLGRAPSAPANTPPQWSQLGSVCAFISDAARTRGFATPYSDLKLWRLADGRVTESTVKLPASATGWQSSASGELILFSNSKDEILYDPPSGYSFSVRNARLLFSVGTRVFGLMNPPQNTLAPGADFPQLAHVRYAATSGTPFRLDLRAGTTPQTAPDIAVGPGWQVGAARFGTAFLSVYRGGTIFLWDDKAPAPRWVGLPGLPDWTGFGRLSDALFAVNARVLTADELRTCMDLTKLLRARSGVGYQPMPQIDGFLDEWKDEEFMPAAHGRFAVRLFNGSGWGPADVCLAVEINDPAIIARLMAGGLDGKLDLWVHNGQTANFGMDSAAWGYNPFLLRFPGKQASGSSAWSVTADGRVLRIETYVPGTVNGAWFYFARGAPEPAALYRHLGDLAVRLRWTPDPFTPPENLLGDKPSGPLSVERILFKPATPK